LFGRHALKFGLCVKNSFYLVIPEQKNDPQLMATFSDAALTQWVTELPTANPGLATRLFQEMLGELISLGMPAAKRLSALELLRPNFLTIEDFLRSRLTKSGFPKSENERKTFAVLVTMERQLTIGYWSVTREMTRRDIGWLQGKTTALVIQRTIEGLSSIVISHYMMSSAIPDWIWIDLHSLYRLSVKLGKHTTKVSEPGGMFGGRTVEDRYIQILLLSLAYPSGLMQKEFLQVYQFAEKVSELVQIERKPIADQDVQCSILTDEDLAPSFSPTVTEFHDKHSDSARIYLNLGKLHKVIKQADKYCSKDEARFSSLEARKNSDPNQKLSAELFDYLLQRWHGKEPQGTAFFIDRLDRYVAIGLDSTHELQDMTLSGVISGGLEILAETYSDRALTCTFDKEGVLSIGSLISFRKTDEQSHQRSLGVVCKILLPKQDNKLIFELTLITPLSFSVSYLHLDAPPDAERKKALLYGIKSHEGERSFIIMESFMIKDGDILRMIMGQENFPIILMGRKNIGLGYWQFECRRIEEKHVPVQTKKKGYDFI
jgi:cyclic-di-GMP-binding protein